MFVREGKEYASGAGIDNGVGGVKGRVRVRVGVRYVHRCRGMCM